MNVHYVNKVKALFRGVYYAFATGKVVDIHNPVALRGCKWLIDPISNRAYYKGYYEPVLTQFFCKQLTKEAIFLDVGAHVGYFSLLGSMLSPDGKVHSFEPEPANYNLCDKIRQLNNCDNWIVNNLAVGNTAGTLRFNRGKTTTMGHIQSDGELEVKVISLDKYVQSRNLERVDIIKIDVEGFGGSVLRGAVNLLATYRPTIVMEFHQDSDEMDVFRELVMPIYNVFTIGGKAVDSTAEEEYHFLYALPKA